ncbi:MAG: GDSL-type esterase/lipase family protein [Oscillospiraceae bacterium]
MRKLIPLILLVALLAAGCTSDPDAAQVSGAPAPTPPASAEPTPTPSPAPTPTPTPTPEPYDYSAPVPESEAVEDSWFADAVFIGDSRTDGLRLYSGIKDVDFLCYKGLTVFEVMDNKAVIQTDDGKVGVLQALEQKQYGKIYLMLGINELGYYNDQGFADTYAAVVDQIMELQPDADIYLQSLIPVSTEKCLQTKQPYYVTNEQIAVYNEIIETIAAEKQVYLVNVKEALVNEDGELPADASSDGIHFHKEGYQTWYQYLKTHAAEEELS